MLREVGLDEPYTHTVEFPLPTEGLSRSSEYVSSVWFSHLQL